MPFDFQSTSIGLMCCSATQGPRIESAYGWLPAACRFLVVRLVFYSIHFLFYFILFLFYLFLSCGLFTIINEHLADTTTLVFTPKTIPTRIDQFNAELIASG